MKKEIKKLVNQISRDVSGLLCAVGRGNIYICNRKECDDVIQGRRR